MKEYKIDWSKVKTINDIKRILKVLDMTFVGEVEGLDEIKDLLKENINIKTNSKWQA